LPNGGGEDCSGVEGSLHAHGDLLEQQVITDVMEGGERHSLLEEGLEVDVPLVRPSKKVEDEGAIRH
jgi:hypothetical protein